MTTWLVLQDSATAIVALEKMVIKSIFVALRPLSIVLSQDMIHRRSERWTVMTHKHNVNSTIWAMKSLCIWGSTPIKTIVKELYGGAIKALNGSHEQTETMIARKSEWVVGQLGFACGWEKVACQTSHFAWVSFTILATAPPPHISETIPSKTWQLRLWLEHSRYRH